MKRLDVFLLHGIGKSIGLNYYDGFVNAVRSKLPIDLDIGFHPIDYSPLLDTKEATIFSWMEDMGWKKLRRFACDFVCDVLAAAYPRRTPVAGDFIFDLTEMLKAKFAEVGSKYPDSIKILIGHSLGTVIGFNFTWEYPLEHLILMGSPFDYFSIRYHNFGENNPKLKTFVNFWKRYDVVSTIISRNPNFKSVKDIQVRSFNPKYILPVRAHTTGYWDSDFVHSEIAGILKGL